MRSLAVSWVDVRLAVRMLVKHPGLTIVSGLGMAVAIAVVAAFSTLLYTFVYPTLPLPEGDRLVALENWDTAANNEERQAIHDFVTWRDEMRTVVDVAAFRNVGRNLTIPGGSAEPIVIAEITAAGLRTARVAPRLGRLLADTDEAPGAPGVLVLGYDAWQTRFAGDAGAIGRVVQLDGVPHTVVGVMPDGFLFPMNHQYWVPFRVDPAQFSRGEGPALFVFGRLAPGATRAQAQAELSALGARAAAAYPDTHARLRPQALPYTYPLTDIQDMVLWQALVQQLMVMTLLLVVAANVAVLVYARTSTRRREIAVRGALGASRARIVAQLGTEGLLLAGIAGVIGLALAQFGWTQAIAILVEETGTLPFWITRGISLELVVSVAGLTLLTAAIVGVIPALQATGRGLPSTLQQVNAGLAMRLGSTWTVLIVAQVAIVTAALPAGLAAAWSEVVGGLTRPAFAAEEFLVVPVARTADSRPGAIAELVQRLESEPGVDGVSFAPGVPGREPQVGIEAEGVPLPGPLGTFVGAGRVAVNMFDVLGTPLLAGRGFDVADPASPARPVVVNQTFVDEVLGGGDALGRRIRYVDPQAAAAMELADGGAWYEVVGVVADLHVNIVEPDRSPAVLYHPVAVPEAGGVVLVARAREPAPAALDSRIRALAASVDSTLRIPDIRAMDDLDRQARIALRLVSLAMALVAASVLLLSAAGIYAMMAFTVSQRRKEIGIRAALGAGPRHLIRSVFARATAQLLLGVAAGVATAMVLDRLAGGGLMSGSGGVFLPGIALLMLLTGLLAAIGPARRGLRVDPTESLKADA